MINHNTIIIRKTYKTRILHLESRTLSTSSRSFFILSFGLSSATTQDTRIMTRKAQTWMPKFTNDKCHE